MQFDNDYYMTEKNYLSNNKNDKFEDVPIVDLTYDDIIEVRNV